MATENPAYLLGKLLFEMSGLEVSPLPLDPFAGVDLGLWDRTLARSKPCLLYLASTFQNPTGYTYSTSELLEILKMSSRHGFGLLEDDWGSDMLSFSEFRPPLRALGGERVMYTNSFTKKLMPSLRIGYVLGSAETIPSLVLARRVSTIGNPILAEAALFEFLQRGWYEAHVRRVQKELDRRYHACIDALREFMPEGVRWTTPGGGSFLWVELPKRIDVRTLQARLQPMGLSIDAFRHAFYGSPHLNGFRLGYAMLKTPALRRGLEQVAHEVRACAKR